MEALIAKQETSGKEIQRIIANVAKDPQQRKTLEYYQERLRRLEAAWEQFESTDTDIRNHPSVNRQHEYFTTDYYSSIASLYTKYKEAFGSQIQALSSVEDEPKVRRIPAPENPICHLMRKSNAIKAQLDHALRRLSETSSEQPKAFYAVQDKVISDYWQQMEALHLQICEAVDNPRSFGYDTEDFLNRQDQVLKANISLTERLQSSELQPTVTLEQTVRRNGNASIKLPKIEIPRFDGNYLKWRQFYDLFSEIVHKQDISPCEKLWYLRANLSGEAENLIKHLSLSNDNYAAAWQILKERYENPRLIVNALLANLLGQSNHTTDSAANIKSLHDTTRECLKGLENIGISTTGWDPLLLFILIQKLHKGTHALYEQSIAHPRQLQTLNGLLDFLENRFQSLEALGSKPKSVDEKHSPSAKSLAATSISNCIACNASHPVFSCKSFLSLTPENRLKLIQRHSRCVNCLQTDHSSKNCTKGTCKHCSKKHNTLLHLERKQDSMDKKSTHKPRIETSATSLKQSIVDKQQCEATSLATGTIKPQSKYVMLSTVAVTIEGIDGSSTTCRAVLDSGSQVNILSARICKKLGLDQYCSNLKIHGIGNGRQHTTARVNFLLKSRNTAFSTRVEAYVLPRIISPQPSKQINVSGWDIPGNIKLADPQFFRPDRIDLLLGVEFYYQLLSVGQIKLGDNLPILQNTVLGWIVGGAIEGTDADSMTCGIGIDDDILSQQVERFWELESIQQPRKYLSSSEKQCESHFARWTTRMADGRYEVSLPFITDPPALGDSRKIALDRFEQLERRLKRHPDLKAEYVKFMDEYLQLGHMQEISNIPSKHYYLPHHCVTKPDSHTTKVRVVFDASAKTSTNVSLNDILLKGPAIQETLFAILLRFREHKYVLTADIEKMYRQISIKPEQRCFQLIFWRRSTDDPIRQYQLNTVTYGTRPASYLATKCLETLAKENQSEFPYAAQALQQNCYVDDVITGSNSLPELLKTQAELKSLLSQAGFNLRKWCANDKRLLNQLPQKDLEVCLDFDKDDYVKTLGLIWAPASDEFRMKFTTISTNKISKRSITSDIFRIFDPLGLIAPIVATAKIFLRTIWELKLDWDASLPMSLHTKWTTFREELKTLEDIVIPRHLYSSGLPKSKQLHVFADASLEAFGAAAYLRSVNQDKTVIVRLLCAKSHVAPLKRMSIHRLELCAAKLAAELADRIKEILNMSDVPTFFWTDSQNVLCWIQSQSSDFYTFVANRIGAIHELSSPDQWRHVGSKMNPADVLTRPIAPAKLKTCNLWFFGPLFFYGSESEWPTTQDVPINVEEDVERKVTSLAATVSTSFVFDVKHNNSFARLLRIIGYIVRFINRCKRRSMEQSEQAFGLSQLERQHALRIIVKAIQVEDFKSEVQCLQRREPLPESSAISRLSPFLDDDGILRVGGRLRAADLPFETRHPILLPYMDNITRLIMEDIHRNNSHVGAKALEAITKQQFWPIKCGTLARSVVHKCITCTRAKPKFLTQMMGDLPATRVQPARPFINTGVDFCGPVYYHFQIRGKRPQKTYIAVFCCFATKAVHLELVSDLSTEAFLGALKRFIGRRGHCRQIYCDNATNFVGAKNKLQEISTCIYSDASQDLITSKCSENGIDFHFIPPRAPHFGGLWEAAVKSAKELMKKSIGTASLTYEMLSTVLVEIESILNSRPLTPLSSDPNDPRALTPGHFLIGEPLTTQVDPEAECRKGGMSGAWRDINRIKRDFWQRWSTEYLHLLQHRQKWKRAMPNVPIDTIVVIKDDNLPVLKWPLGRVVRTYKGNDGLVRVADIKTQNRTLTRPIHRLAPLPIEDSTLPEGSTTGENLEKEAQEQEHFPLRRSVSSNDADSQTEATPKKKKKLSCGALLAALFTCLLIPSCDAGNAPITIQRLNNSLGINFEHMGTITHVTDEWKILVYYDLTSYWEEMASLSNGTMALRKLCELSTYKSNCEHLVLQFEQDQLELQLDNSLFSTRRTKRGALNVVGSLANTLFGVLDSKYADEMSVTISKIKGDQQQLVELLKNQTSVIDSTINLIKIDQISAQKKFKRVEQRINLIMQRINLNSTEDTQQRIFQIMTTLCLQLVAASANLHRIQSSIIEILTDAHHGTLSPLLLSPNQLHDEMKNIKDKLPTDVHLPLTSDDVLPLYRIMRAAGRILDNLIVFTIKIPLTDKRSYQLFHLTPLAIVVNKTLVSIKLSANMLAVNAHRDTYFLTSEDKINSCLTIGGSYFLCEKTSVIYHTGALPVACEMNLLKAEPTQACQTEIMPLNRVWMPLVDKNKWIFGLIDQMRLQVVCGDQQFKIQLEGAGILTLQPNCVMKHDSITITGHSIISSEVNNTFKASSILVEIPSSIPSILFSSDNEDYQPQTHLLENLQQTLRKQTFELSTSARSPYTSYHVIPGYISVILTLAIISVIFWKGIRRAEVCKSKKNQQRPVPATRASKRPDLSIKIDPGF